MSNTIEKVCKHHGLTTFVITKNRSKKSGIDCRCVLCKQNSLNKKRRIVKEKSVAYKGGCCEKCGYNKCITALEFHHVDGNKDFSISDRGYRMPWPKVQLELDKCILVCSNCHREIHYEIDGYFFPKEEKKKPEPEVKTVSLSRFININTPITNPKGDVHVLG